jgi:stage II sporulation protein D
VLGLFHPKEVIVAATMGYALVLKAGGQNLILESSQFSSAIIRIEGSALVIGSGKREFRAASLAVAGRGDASEDFILAIPGKIKRRYHGTLVVQPSFGNLLAVVTVDLETAVASVVAAESAPDTPFEAFKANAIAARSYFVAGRGRHKGFDFCDTTHCQFLRTPPPATSLAAQAVAATQSLVLMYQSKPFAAMYTRSCSGRTRTPVELGLPSANYPYYSVECEQCRRHPVRWSSYLSIAEAGSLHPSNENMRLGVVQRLGWSAIPSNEFSIVRKGDQLELAGVGNGHGIGLCQAGAKAMAESGASFQVILHHYYPNAGIVEYPGRIPLESPLPFVLQPAHHGQDEFGNIDIAPSQFYGQKRSSATARCGKPAATCAHQTGRGPA